MTDLIAWLGFGFQLLSIIVNSLPRSPDAENSRYEAEPSTLDSLQPGILI